MAGRRNFDLAHELFHILTWDAMPPEHVEYASDFGGNRVERFANHFAASVLMPTTALESYDAWAQLDMEGLIAQLNHVADELCVTSSALRWRLVALRRLTKSKARAIPETALRNNGRTTHAEEAPALFSKPFAEVLAAAVDGGPCVGPARGRAGGVADRGPGGTVRSPPRRARDPALLMTRTPPMDEIMRQRDAVLKEPVEASLPVRKRERSCLCRNSFRTGPAHPGASQEGNCPANPTGRSTNSTFQRSAYRSSWNCLLNGSTV